MDVENNPANGEAGFHAGECSERFARVAAAFGDLPDATTPLNDRAGAVSGVIDLLIGNAPNPDADLAVRSFAHWLAGDPERATTLRVGIERLVDGLEQRYLLAQTGVASVQPTLRSILSRWSEIALPPERFASRLRDLVLLVLADRRRREALRRVTAETWSMLSAIYLGARCNGEALPLVSARVEAEIALAWLAAQAGGLATGDEWLDAGQRWQVDLQALQTLHPLVHTAALNGHPIPDRTLRLRAIAQAQRALGSLRSASAAEGTSIALSFDMHRAQTILDRMRDLVLASDPESPQIAASAIGNIVQAIIEGESKRRRPWQAWSDATDDLSRLVTEHASHTGEHYVAASRAEWRGMLRAALVGGSVVAFMALAKIGVMAEHLPLLWQTLLVGSVYAGGFVLIQLLGGTVATKQPAMTAALMAREIEGQGQTPQALTRLVELMLAMIRTQLAAIVGNIAAAVPAAVLVAWAVTAWAGPGWLDTGKAQGMLAELHPLLSWAIPHAAIAGVCLFLAGIVSGHADNRCLYRRVPQRLAVHPWLTRWLGPRRAQSLADWVEHSAGGLAGNVAFGLMLAGVAFVGYLTGLPLDIRHVTFAAANAAYALMTLEVADLKALGILTVGIFLVGIVNLSVSFLLALGVALRARSVEFRHWGLLLKLLGRRVARRPRDLILPPLAP